MNKIHQVPTHLFLGFLGTGKTSAILNCFTQKPKNERWAVLVNEFGKQGIDGKIYSNKGIMVQEIAGGCLCCAAGVTFQVAVIQLLKTQRPDRLFIESSGASHAQGVIDTLKQESFKNALDLKASLCFIDPMHLLNQRYTSNVNFKAQLQVADVLIANKTDLANSEALNAFDNLATQFNPDKALMTKTSFGKMDLDWLEIKVRPSSSRPNHTKALDQSLQSLSWSFPQTTQFDSKQLSSWLTQRCFLRAKSIANTTNGWQLFNAVDQQVKQEKFQPSSESQIEVVIESNNSQLKPELKKSLDNCIINP